MAAVTHAERSSAAGDQWCGGMGILMEGRRRRRIGIGCGAVEVGSGWCEVSVDDVGGGELLRNAGGRSRGMSLGEIGAIFGRFGIGGAGS